MARIEYVRCMAISQVVVAISQVVVAGEEGLVLGLWVMCDEVTNVQLRYTMERSEEERVVFKLFSVPSLSDVFETKEAKVVVATGGGMHQIRL